MIWTYRVFCDSQGRYSIREVFYEQDATIINYTQAPVTVLGSSVEELMQMVQWFREAFDLPVLSLEEVDAEIATRQKGHKPEHSRGISLQQVIAELASDTDPVNQP